MSYHPCPGEVFIKKWRKTTASWAMEAYLNRQLKIQRTKSVREWLALYSYPNLLSQPCLTWRHYQQR
jgi:signal-transduction protein with cAMP-binding, CBS, and nucleotidyltransferase domain